MLSMSSVLHQASRRAILTPLSLRCLSASASRAKAVENMKKLFNSQITAELNASQLNLSASIWFSEKELTGMAAFALKESQDERAHAIELIDFGLKRDISIDLEALPAPHAHWESIEALWVDLLEYEKKNSDNLYTLADAAYACQDHALVTFLQPFHTEQVNAVASLKTLVAKVREESRTPGLIRQLDGDLQAKSSAGG